jgi:glucose-6-phosphate 1-epimerase
MHGFARTTAWTLVAADRMPDGAAAARLSLADSEASRALWPHRFACELTVQASGKTLAVEIAVVNTGDSAFAFTMALHSYLAVHDARAVAVDGLAGVRYRDKVLRRDDELQASPQLAVDRPLDRVYRATPALTVREPARDLAVRSHGVTDTVVWNPGPPADPTPIPGADMAPDAWRHFLCVEAAVASTTVTLAPGASWRGGQTLTA